jgi:hypothetical protein
MLHPLDPNIRSALTSLASDLPGEWAGRRERELVSLFCFGYLIRQCTADSFLHDPTQIGIEVPVPQIKGQMALTGHESAKSQVCKDIVIWPRPRMTCWDDSGLPTVTPASIIEWKHNEKDVSDYDAQWLTEFSTGRPDFMGYAVCTHDKSFTDFRLSCSRIANGQVEHRWLLVK